MNGKIVLIDGHSILNRAFYGVPDLTNSEGLHTNAVYGFLNIMLKILDEEKPDYLTVAFDVKHPTFRHEMYADYKGTRKGMPDELKEQVPLIQEMLRAMGVRLVIFLARLVSDMKRQAMMFRSFPVTGIFCSWLQIRSRSVFRRQSVAAQRSRIIIRRMSLTNTALHRRRSLI